MSNANFVPEFNFSTDYSLSTTVNFGSKTKVNMYYKNVGRLPNFLMDEDVIVESYTEAYSLLDFSINRIISESLILLIGGKNILDIKDVKRTNDIGSIHSSSNNSIPVGYGRTYFLALKIRL